jgi:hypothetical protein
MNPTTHNAIGHTMAFASKPASVSRYCMAILLGLSIAFASSQEAKAVEISFFAEVPLTVDTCDGLDACVLLGGSTVGHISGVVDIVDPLADEPGAFAPAQDVVFSAPPLTFPLPTGGVGFESFLSGGVLLDYVAPTSPGQVAEMSVVLYSLQQHVKAVGGAC